MKRIDVGIKGRQALRAGLWCVLLAASLATGRAAAHGISRDNLFDLSLEELLTLELTGAARKAQALADTAAAAFVISAEDLKRSGAANIAEALRMVPGLEVGAIDGNSYAISARGYNDRYATKMLMMIDGRAVYTPAYSGVYWEIQDLPMTEIERIEVVRGPGGALWGVNAVNGVINVVTREAGVSLGGQAIAGAGDRLDHDLSVSWDASFEESGGYRLYGQREQWDGNQDMDGNSLADTREISRIGGRIDWSPSAVDDVTLTGSLYSVDSGVSLAQVQREAPFERMRVDDERETDGAYLVGNWRHQSGLRNESAVTAYLDYLDRDDPGYGEEKTTVEIDFQHRWLNLAGHDLIAGATLRYHDIELTGSEDNFFTDTNHDNLIFSVFAQDEIELVDDTLFLTLGARAEYNDFSDSDLEFMPTARLLWRQSERTSFWAAASRAVRTPNLGEQYSVVSLPLDQYLPGLLPEDAPFAAFLQLEGSAGAKSEDLYAYELGFRSQVTDQLHVDLALYYNRYENLRWPKFTGIECVPTGGAFPACLGQPGLEYVDFMTQIANASDGEAWGAELAVNWRVSEHWQLLAAYTGSDYETRPDTLIDSQGMGFRNQLSLQSRHDFNDRVALDLWLRYVDEVEFYDIDDYWSLNLRLAYRLSDALEFALVGTDLLDGSHQEYETEVRDLVPVEIERAVRAEFRFRF